MSASARVEIAAPDSVIKRHLTASSAARQGCGTALHLWLAVPGLHHLGALQKSSNSGSAGLASGCCLLILRCLQRQLRLLQHFHGGGLLCS